MVPKIFMAAHKMQRMASALTFLERYHKDDNARPHTAARTPAVVEHFNLELFDHPPYSPDLAMSDNHLFTYLKNSLGS
jgi:hypothetical protein